MRKHYFTNTPLYLSRLLKSYLTEKQTENGKTYKYKKPTARVKYKMIIYAGYIAITVTKPVEQTYVSYCSCKNFENFRKFRDFLKNMP